MNERRKLKEWLKYNPRNGVFVWIKGSGSRAKRGQKAGSIFTPKPGRSTSYIRIMVCGKRYFAHRLAWLYVYGEWPSQIDHIDGDGLNNKITNLRDVSYRENHKNRPRTASNRTGIVGVSYNKKMERFIAYISNENGNKYLGCFKTKFDAAIARYIAEKQYGYHDNHGRANINDELL